MIKLENIQIEYQEKLIQNGELEIQNGVITCITGPSGTGKTSLLYLIGLLEKQKDLRYYFDDNLLDLTNESVVSNLKRTKIGYVFQDYNLFEDFTIQQHFKYNALLTNVNLTDDKIIQYLKMVRIDEPLDKRVKQLSGGQKQRLAIALTLIKQPQLIILDEPTSSLDLDNTLIVMQILKDIAKKDNVMIFIASHSKAVLEHSDVVYRLQNKCIFKEKSITYNNQVKSFKDILTKIPYRFYVYFITTHIKNNKRLFALLFTCIAFITGLVTINQSLSDVYIQKQYAQFEKNYAKEIFVATNQGGTNRCIYFKDGLNISSELLNKIKEIPSVNNATYYKEWIINEYYFNNQKYEKPILVVPYISSDRFKKDIIQDEINDTGVYISYNLQENNSDQGQIELIIDNEFFELPVKGVLSKYHKNQNTMFTNLPIIYIPYSIVEKNLQSSSMIVVETNKINEMKLVTDKIVALDETLGASTVFLENRLIEESFSKLKQMAQIFSYFLFSITIAGCAMIYYKMICNRIVQIALLKANGMSVKQIIWLFIQEIIFHITIITSLSLIMMFVTKILVYLIFNEKAVIFSVNNIIKLLSLNTFALSIPMLITLMIILKKSTVTILRG